MRTPSAICAVLLFAGALPGRAATADEVPRVRMISVDETTLAAIRPQHAGDAEESRVGHCSIVGAVHCPGTYTGNGGSVLLQTLIEQAGGLTRQASGIVRILHSGRQEVINLAVSVDALAVPWESVIVADLSVTDTHLHAAEPPLFCDIACVNLCDRPAVFCLKPQHATLRKLLELLGQPPEVAATVRVVLPAGATMATDHALPSGSVVLFNAAALDQPALADILQRSPLQDLVAIQTDGPQPASANVVGQLHTLEKYLRADAASPAAQSESAPAAMATTAFLPPITATLSSAPPTLTAPDPSVERAPPNTLVRPASAFQLQPVSPRHPIVEEFTDADYERAKQKTLAAKGRTQAGDEVVATAAVEPGTHWLRNATSVVAWLLCGLAAYGAFGVWMRQHERRRRETLRNDLPIELPKPAAHVESRSMLSQLIENSLPIREEEVTSPCQVFHGRTVGFRYLIRSGPHGLQGPHFAAQRAQSRPAPVTVAAGVRSRPESTESAPAARERTINRVDRATEGLPPRDSDRPAASSPPAPRGVSPLERALRSLMRESTEGRT